MQSRNSDDNSALQCKKINKNEKIQKSNIVNDVSRVINSNFKMYEIRNKGIFS